MKTNHTLLASQLTIMSKVVSDYHWQLFNEHMDVSNDEYGYKELIRVTSLMLASCAVSLEACAEARRLNSNSEDAI